MSSRALKLWIRQLDGLKMDDWLTEAWILERYILTSERQCVKIKGERRT